MKWKKFIFISLGISSILFCCHPVDEVNLEVPLGTSTFLKNGKRVSGVRLDTNYLPGLMGNIFQLHLYANYHMETFSLNANLDLSDEMLNKQVNKKRALRDRDTRISYLFYDEDEPQYEYRLVKGTGFVKIDKFSRLDSVINIRFGGTFIRIGTSDLFYKDFPYRMDLMGIYHGKFRIF